MVPRTVLQCNPANLSPWSYGVSAVPTMQYFIALSGESLLIRLDLIVAIGEDEDGHATLTLSTGREIVLQEQFGRIADDLSKGGVFNVIGKEEYESQLDMSAEA